MQISIEQDELESAVRDYVIKMGIKRAVGAISFTATRGESGGIKTTVEVGDAMVEPVASIVANKGAQTVEPKIDDKDVQPETIAKNEAAVNGTGGLFSN